MNCLPSTSQEDDEVALLHGHWVDALGFHHRVRRPADLQLARHPYAVPEAPPHRRPVISPTCTLPYHPARHENEERLDIERSEDDSDVETEPDVALDEENGHPIPRSPSPEISDDDSDTIAESDAALDEDNGYPNPRSPSPALFEPVVEPVPAALVEPQIPLRQEYLRFPGLRELSIQLCRDSAAAGVPPPAGAVLCCVTDITRYVVMCCRLNQGHILASIRAVGQEGTYVGDFFRIPSVDQPPILFLWKCICAEIFLSQHPLAHLILDPILPW